MGLIPEDIIHQVIERTDIVEVIGGYTSLKKVGHSFKALCPFHNEKTPSFWVNSDKQIFHCFGCDAGGNVVGFLMRQEHMSFPEAVRFLAGKAGITIPEDTSGTPGLSRTLGEDVCRVNALAAGFFHDTLVNGHRVDAKQARDYLKGRGVDLETVKKFQLGFAPNEWDALLKFLKSKGIGEELMLTAGLTIAPEGKNTCYDRFRNRVMFPIIDVQNRCRAFGGRAMGEDGGAKYINSPETPVYAKGVKGDKKISLLMFGMNLTKTAISKTNQVIVVEGYMDMIMPYAHGVENIVASLGTALTVDQISLIRRYASDVVMLYDADAAGQSAIVRSLDLLLDEEANVRVAALSPGEDPDSFIRKQGPEAFKARIDGAQSFLDFKFNWLAAQHDPSTVEGKAAISRELMGTIGRCRNEVARYEYTRQLSQKLGVPEGVLHKQASAAKAIMQAKPELPPKAAAFGASATASAQELLLALFLKDPAWVAAVREHLGPQDFSGTALAVAQAIWSMDGERSEWSANDLLLGLDDQQAQSLVTRLINIEEGKLSDAAVVFRDCVAKIRQDKQKKAMGAVIDAMRQAEANKDMEKLQQLREEFNELLKGSLYHITKTEIV